MIRPPLADLTSSKIKRKPHAELVQIIQIKTENRRPQCQPSREDFLISKSTYHAKGGTYLLRISSDAHWTFTVVDLP